ncbi:MAG: guanine permease [Waddliaceae bacterium]|nr:guanine permease [Waddliaceae bacterium]
MLKLTEKLFRIQANGSDIKTELIAGFTTFSTMAYILVVNPMILSQAGMDFGAVLVATILAAVLGNLVMGFYANLPFALAPGMGLNAYFTYTVVLGMGIPWQTALGAVFLSGVAFTFLNLLGIRKILIDAIPESLQISVSAGLGLFLSLIAMKNVGLIQAHPSTLLALGDLSQPSCWLTGFGLVITCTLLQRAYRAAIILGILATWAMGIIVGAAKWGGFFSWPASLAPTFMQMDVWAALDLGAITIIFSFLFVDLFDTLGTFVGITQQGGLMNERGRIPHLGKGMMADAVATIGGAMLGTSTVTTYLESASGVAAGGRTGLTAIVVAALFACALFFEPLFQSIPPFATAPALLLIGAMLTKQIAQLDWDKPSEYLPGFIVIITIPMSFSITTGIALGILIYPITKLACRESRDVHWLLWVLAGIFFVKFAYLGAL